MLRSSRSILRQATSRVSNALAPRTAASSSFSGRTITGNTTQLRLKSTNAAAVSAPFDFDTQEVSAVEENEEDDVMPGQRALEDFNLSPKLVRNLQKANITSFFPVQSASFELMSNGHDIVGKSKTGSGKTLAFLVPIVEKLIKEGSSVSKHERLRALIMLPTRELAMQVSQEFKRIASPDFSCVNLVGGMSIDDQIYKLSRGVDVAVGTPGRVNDLINRSELNLDYVQTVVLDEADMMLKVGFKEEVETIFHNLPEERQGVLWSATFPPWVKSLSKSYLSSPKEIDLVGDDDMKIPSTVSHKAIVVRNEFRPSILSTLIDVHNAEGQTLVFTQTKKEVEDLSRTVSGPKTRTLHGDLSQSTRTETINGFRSGKYQTIVCTDIAARGLDIANVDLVIHYRLPTDRESFVHRTGRTGRAGRSGMNMVLFDDREGQEMKSLEKEYGIKFTHACVPGMEQLVKNANESSKDKIQNVSPKATKLFRSAAEELLQAQGVDAFSAALASLHGFSKNLPDTYSLLSGKAGFQTTRVTGTSQNEVLSVINSNFGKAGRDVIRPYDVMEYTRSDFLVDIPTWVVDKMENVTEWAESEGLTMEKVDSLNELFGGVRRNYNNSGGGGGFNNRGRSNDRFNGGGGYRGGGGGRGFDDRRRGGGGGRGYEGRGGFKNNNNSSGYGGSSGSGSYKKRNSFNDRGGGRYSRNGGGRGSGRNNNTGGSADDFSFPWDN